MMQIKSLCLNGSEQVRESCCPCPAWSPERCSANSVFFNILSQSPSCLECILLPNSFFLWKVKSDPELNGLTCNKLVFQRTN